MAKDQEPDIKDIDDARVILKIKGKSYAVLPNEEVLSKEDARAMRIVFALELLKSHYVVTPSLEEISKKHKK